MLPYAHLGKEKIRQELTATTPHPPKEMFNFFRVFYFVFAGTMEWELLPFSTKLLEHGAAWLEDLLQFSNNFDAPNH
jgi:hypothetical protein